MGCANPAGNIKIQPVKVSFGRYNCSKVTCTADVSSSHKNDYFTFADADNNPYYAWYNVGGAGVDPAATGTGVEVAIAVNATASEVAAATAAAIDAVTGGIFESTADGAEVCICNMQPGACDPVAAGTGLAGFVYATTIAGSLVNRGFCDGDIEPQNEVSTQDVTSHQTGPNPLTKIVTGKTMTLDLALQELTEANFQLAFGGVGKVGTPTGGTKEVIGWGDEQNGQNLINTAGKLILHPYNLPDSDRSQDLCYWLATLVPSSIVFSGENPALMNVSFTAFFDSSRQRGYNFMVRGDHLQAGNYKA